MQQYAWEHNSFFLLQINNSGSDGVTSDLFLQVYKKKSPYHVFFLWLEVAVSPLLQGQAYFPVFCLRKNIKSSRNSVQIRSCLTVTMVLRRQRNKDQTVLCCQSFLRQEGQKLKRERLWMLGWKEEEQSAGGVSRLSWRRNMMSFWMRVQKLKEDPPVQPGFTQTIFSSCRLTHTSEDKLVFRCWCWACLF